MPALFRPVSLIHVAVFLSVFAVLTFAPNLDFWGATWLFPWFEALLFCAIVASHGLLRIHPSLAILSVVTLTNGIVSFAYVAAGTKWPLGHVGNAAYSVAAFGSLLFVGITVPSRVMRMAFVCSGLGTAAGIIVKAALGSPVSDLGVFIGNPSMTGCFIACALPFMVIGRPRSAIHAGLNVLIVALCVVAITLLHATIPWLCLGAAVVAGIAREYRRTIPYMAAALIMVGTAVLLFWHLLEGIDFFGDSGRFLVWSVCIKHWLAAPLGKKLFGFGLGSMQVLLPKWFPASYSTHDWWIFSHNDVLQTLLMLGIVGELCAAYVAVSAFRIAWKRSTRTTASLAGIVVWCFFNYPMEIAFTALFCSSVVLAVFKSNAAHRHDDMLGMVR